MSTQPAAGPIRIGARGSKLSLAQSGTIQRRIAAALGVDPTDQAEVERVAPLVVITTTGDRIQDRRLLEIGGKGLFTKEIEDALLEGRIDCAVLSRLVAEHRLDEDEAAEVAIDLAYRLPKAAYRL